MSGRDLLTVSSSLFEPPRSFLLRFPATVGVGALLGFGIMVSATVANIFILHHDFIHSTIPAIIFAMIAWTYRSQILKLMRCGNRDF